MEYQGMDEYNRPKRCPACNGVLVFKGVGEYQCEDCKSVEYDDYGKVRLYIEQHRGVNAAEIEAGTGVKQRSIRNMLREERLEVTKDSRSFLKCFVCGKDIRFGKYCPECKIQYHRNLEAKERVKRNLDLAGFGMEDRKFEEGEKRFSRKK